MTNLRYFAYVSRSKVSQLYEQIADLSSDATERLEKRRDVDRKLKATGGLRSLLGAEVETSGLRSVISEVTGVRSDIQKLQAVLEHIDRVEYVADLNVLCAEGSGATLDALAYVYRGSFQVLGELARRRSDGYGGGLRINESVLSGGPDEIVLSQSALVEPARRENAYAEVGPNSGSLVSDIALLVSLCGDYTISLACSYKYFSEMGGSWSERVKEWHVGPHSGNHQFFEGDIHAFLEGLLFVNGVRGKTIYASPLFLNYAIQDGLHL